MGLVTTFSVGAASIEVLARRLHERRGGSLLAPAHVLCSSPMMAVGVRRALGRRPGGVAGVTTGTVSDFAFELARPVMALANVRLAIRAELIAALRFELQAQPGRFGAVAGHRRTEDRLVDLHRELSGLPIEALDAVEAKAGGLPADAIRVVRAAVARLDSVGIGAGPDWSGNRTDRRLIQSPRSADWVLAAALDALGDLATGARGPLMLYMLDPVRPFEGRLVQALARRDDAEVLVGLTGHDHIDTRHLRRLTAWSIQVPDRPGSQGPSVSPNSLPPTASVLEVADPEEEVRAALRDVAAHAAAGIALSEMAVLYTSPEPYAGLLEDQLAATEFNAVGPGHRRLTATLAGRTLRRLLELTARGLDRDGLMTLLAAAPIDEGDGEEPPVGLWDSLSRQAGVIDGEHWIPRLQDLRRANLDPPDQNQIERMAAFIDELKVRLEPPETPTWSAWSAWSRQLLERYLLRSSSTWPETELTALRLIDEQLGALAALDSLGVPPTPDTFEATVLGDLASASLPGHLQGPGLFVAPLAAAPGLSFKRIVVVGLAEGRFPRVARGDSLLSDGLRAGGRGMLADTTETTHLDTRAVALAVGASERPALLVTARGDLRSNRSRAWPRVLDSMVEGRYSLDSHHQSLLDHGRPVNANDFGLRSLVSHVNGDNPVYTHPLAQSDPILASNLARHANLEREQLSAHTGRVPAGRFDPTEHLLSPTALETYAACPRKYLLQRVLRLSDDKRPERIEEVTARDRGLLMHQILERFIDEAISEDDVPTPIQPWSAARRARLFELMDEAVAAAAARGITGGQVRTRLLRRRMYTELLNFLDTDDEQRRRRGSTPYAVEYRFGLSDENSALAGQWAGRDMLLRGSVDRVDFTDDGGLLVIDYKGGSGHAYNKLEENPLDNGRRLQLPLYARAVAEKLGRSGKRTGLYWLTKTNKVKDMILDDSLEEQLESAVGAALAGIDLGLFPAVPGDAVGWPRLSYENCRYCDFDRICPTNRQSEWEQVRDDNDLEAINLLIAEANDQSRPS